MLHIYGFRFNQTIGRFVTFNADTGLILSDHRTQAEANAACQRYEKAALTRLHYAPLANLARRAV